MFSLFSQGDMRARIDGKVGKIARRIADEPFGGDHGGVVGTKFLFRQDGANAVLRAGA